MARAPQGEGRAAGHQSGPGWTAPRVGVEMSKANTAVGDAVNMKSFDLASVIARVAPSHVVGYQDQDVRLSRCGARRPRQGERKRGEFTPSHGHACSHAAIYFMRIDGGNRGGERGIRTLGRSAASLSIRPPLPYAPLPVRITPSRVFSLGQPFRNPRMRAREKLPFVLAVC